MGSKPRPYLENEFLRVEINPETGNIARLYAEIVAAQSAAAGKAIVEKLGKKLFVLSERHQAVADIAGRKNAEIAPQPAGTAALVRDGDNGSEPRNLGPKLGGACGFCDVVLETTENRRQTRAPTNGDNFH